MSSECIKRVIKYGAVTSMLHSVISHTDIIATNSNTIPPPQYERTSFITTMADLQEGPRRSARLQKKSSAIPPPPAPVMSSRKRQASTISKRSKKTKATHPIAAPSGKGKERAVSSSPAPHVQHFTITEFKFLYQTVAHFSLRHCHTHYLGLGGESNPYNWPISDAMVYGWISNELGPDIVREIDLAVEPGSALSEVKCKHFICRDRGDEYSSRPVADLILLTATSIISGFSAIYRHRRAGAPVEGAPHAARGALKELKLIYDVPMAFHDEATGRQYIGRMDWVLGLVGHLPWLPVGPQGIRTGSGYRALLVVVDAKPYQPPSQPEARLMAYMGCLYRNREARGIREDCSVFGAITNGMMWEFYMLDHQGAFGKNKQRTHVPVRQSKSYTIFTHDGLRKVLGMIIYILQRGATLITPQGSLMEGEDDGEIAGPGAVNRSSNPGYWL